MGKNLSAESSNLEQEVDFKLVRKEEADFELVRKEEAIRPDSKNNFADSLVGRAFLGNEAAVLDAKYLRSTESPFDFLNYDGKPKVMSPLNLKSFCRATEQHAQKNVKQIKKVEPEESKNPKYAALALATDTAKFKPIFFSQQRRLMAFSKAT